MPSKLDPLSVPYRVGVSLSRFGWLLVVGTVSAGTQRLPLLVGLFGVVLLATLAYQVAYVRRFSYELTADTFDVYSGVFSRRSREIPYHRIQNVDVTRNVVQRALGIAELAIETAGGGETEATLQYLDVDTADELRAALSRRKRGETEDGATEQTAREREALFSITTRELLLLGVVGLDLRLLSFVAVTLPVVLPSVSEATPLFDLFRVAPFLLAGLAVLALAASMVQAVVSYYGFELHREGDELGYRRGLAKEYSGTIPLDKVQSVVLTENMLARRLGYASVAIETAGYSPSGDSAGSQSAVPLAERDHAYALAQEVEAFGDPTFDRPPKRARTRYAVRYALAVLVVTGVATAAVRLVEFTSPVPTATLLAGLVLVPVAAHLRWANLGYAVEEDHFVARAGFWSRRTQVVPFYRTQTIAEQATIFQRRRDLASVVVDTAGTHGWSAPSAPDIDARRASDLRETLEARLQAALRARRDTVESAVQRIDSDTSGEVDSDTPDGRGGHDHGDERPPE
ncbi:PH domain-containing protein [Halosegnis rubeus]|uniref:PH domain-containing protein n=1 Tax=Halosegnis rubeus TaxID=2212850 RepID=A0A5N5UIT5_9EURY|nr:PH domain-containing protein [Halosegnis rubeus]KAB7518669.1 PH domain-containing protein [Halosegnis rubeus]